MREHGWDYLLVNEQLNNGYTTEENDCSFHLHNEFRFMLVGLAPIPFKTGVRPTWINALLL